MKRDKTNATLDIIMIPSEATKTKETFGQEAQGDYHCQECDVWYLKGESKSQNFCGTCYPIHLQLEKDKLDALHLMDRFGLKPKLKRGTHENPLRDAIVGLIQKARNQAWKNSLQLLRESSRDATAKIRSDRRRAEFETESCPHGNKTLVTDRKGRRHAD